tara:strand:+ start:1118 stop:2431 length:1314 start_codon:yes stop_codon:yes gene_type:complete
LIEPLPARHVSIITAASFIVASMVGTGVFTSLGFQLISIQSVFPILMLWVVGGIIAFCGALSYSELVTALPRSGGEYQLLSRILHPSIGFGAGIVSSTVGFTAPAVLAAMAFGSYLSVVITGLNQMMTTIIVITFFHVLHMRSVKWGTSFQNTSTLIKIVLIVIFIVFGALSEASQPISIVPKIGDGLALLSSGFAVSLVWVSYAYTGWNSVIYIAGEVRDPNNNISRSMFLSTGIVMLLYILLNYIFLYTAPISSLIGVVDVGYISGTQIFGDVGGKVIGIGISILLLSTVSSYVYIGPRIIQIMGEDHSFLELLKIKNADDIPLNAFWLQLLLSYLFILTASFEQVLVYAGISLIITSTLTVFSLFILRIKEPDLHRPYKVWGYPFIPLIFLIVNIWIIFYSIMETPFESLIGIGIILLSTLSFFIIPKFIKSSP